MIFMANAFEDIARRDIEKRLEGIQTIGEGSSEEGSAYLILQMFDVAKRRLGNKGAIKLVYVDNPEVPEGLRNIMSDYLGEKIDQTQAEKKLDDMKGAYENILTKNYGLKPSRPTAIFMKSDTK
jgi:hypothetical protein